MEECWGISAHANRDCRIATGPLAGMFLSQVWDERPELFGGLDGDRFPLLVKILDATDDLSVQVHPGDVYAAEHENGSLGKTECWYVIDCDDDATIIVGQRAASWDERPELFGGLDGDRFPLLVKILDATDDLSVQVHPGDVYAAEHENGSLGKTECWYVIDCDDDATIIVGQRAASREELAAAIEEGRWGEVLNEIPIHPGDFFQIDAGTVHAIKRGTVILETQQSSDVTYRLYDYDLLPDRRRHGARH